MSQENKFLRAIWIKANKEGRLSITYPNTKHAEQMRQKLYNVTRGPSYDSDPELKLARAACEILLKEEKPGGPATLWIQRIDHNPVLLEAAKQLGIDLSGDNAEGPEASLERILEGLPEEDDNNGAF